MSVQKIALTNKVRDQWLEYTKRVDPTRQHPPLVEICSECQLMDPPPYGFRVDRYTPYAHPNYPGYFFTTVLNAQGEILFTGMLAVRTPRTQQTDAPISRVTVCWEETPGNMSLQETESYAAQMRHEAIMLCNRREITDSQCEDRLNYLRQLVRTAWQDHHSQQIREDELMLVIDFLRRHNVDDEIIDRLSNFEHRFDVEDEGSTLDIEN